MSDADRNRLVACRECGNRVSRGARRCPACGTRDPASVEAAPAGHERVTARAGGDRSAPRAPQQAGRRRHRALVAMLSVLILVTAAGLTALYITTPPVAPPLPRQPEPAPTPDAAREPAPPPSTAEPPSPPSPGADAPPRPPASAEPPSRPPSGAELPARPSPGAGAASRSRGRSDWLFFFKPGDWLARMADDAPLGVVVRLEKTHTFADGTLGPAYVVQSIEGEERIVDADELERSARLR